jgi:hypothetical protein
LKFLRIDDAFEREKQVKGWTKAKKEALINGRKDLLHDLASCKNRSHFQRNLEKTSLEIPPIEGGGQNPDTLA